MTFNPAGRAHQAVVVPQCRGDHIGRGQGERLTGMRGWLEAGCLRPGLNAVERQHHPDHQQ